MGILHACIGVFDEVEAAAESTNRAIVRGSSEASDENFIWKLQVKWPGMSSNAGFEFSIDSAVLR